MMLRFIFILVVLFIPRIAYASTEITIANDPNLIIRQLTNGFKYYLYPTSDKSFKGKVSYRLIVNAGRAYQSDTQDNYAHLVEHMAFQDGAHFTKDDKTSILSQNALQIGRHFNATTQYKFTTFKLDELNATTNKNKKNIAVLKDLVFGALFKPEQVEHQKKIIMQENLYREEKNQPFQSIFQNILAHQTTKKETRLARSDNSGFLSASSEALKIFYETYYQPQMMNLVVAGDFNIQEIENEIKNQFSDFPKGNSEIKNTPSLAPVEGIHYVNKYDDPYIGIKVILPFENSAQKLQTVEDLNKNLQLDMLLGGFESALNELNNQLLHKFPDLAVNLNANLIGGYLLEIDVQATQTNQIEALTFALNYLQKLKSQGFSDEQYKTQLHYVREYVDNSYNNLSNDRSPADIATQLVSEIKIGKKHINQQVEAFLTNQFLNSSNLSIFNRYVESKLDKNIALFVMNPEPLSLDQIKKIESLYESFNNNKQINYKPEFEIHQTFDMSKPNEMGEIIAETSLANGALKKMTLSNGIEVFLQQDKSHKGEIILDFHAAGGNAFLPPDLYPAISVAMRAMGRNGIGNMLPTETVHFLNKHGVSMEPVFTESYHGIEMSAKKPDHHGKIFELLNIALRKPKYTLSNFTQLKKQFVTETKHYNQTAEGQFQKAFTDSIYANENTNLFVTVKQALDIQAHHMDRIFNFLFSDKSKFKLSIYGDFNEKEIKNYLKTYIATMRSKKVNYVPIKRELKSTSNKIRINGRSKKQSLIEIAFFNQKVPKNAQNDAYLFYAMTILKHRLFNHLREDLGLTYHVDIRGAIPRLEHLNNYMIVKFETNPSKEDLAVASVDKVINEISKNGFTQEEINQVDRISTVDFKNLTFDQGFRIQTLSNSVLYNKFDIDYFNFENNFKNVNKRELNKFFKEFVQTSNESKYIFTE